MIQCEQQGEERQSKKTDARKEKRTSDDSANGAFHSGVGANLVKVPNRLHCRGGEHFTGARAKNDGGNHSGRGPEALSQHWEEKRHSSCSSA